jgi:hypothetical protein
MDIIRTKIDAWDLSPALLSRCERMMKDDDVQDFSTENLFLYARNFLVGQPSDIRKREFHHLIKPEDSPKNYFTRYQKVNTLLKKCLEKDIVEVEDYKNLVGHLEHWLIWEYEGQGYVLDLPEELVEER